VSYFNHSGLWHSLPYWHPKRVEERWFNETLAKAPVMPHPLPGEIEGGWDIFRILEEVERLRPIIEAARKEWFERRRAERPPSVVEWLAERAAKPERAPRVAVSREHNALPLDRPLTPTEKHARKLMLTRESNARKRAERKALGLPHK
jgi:hypothetical protein